MYRGLYIIVGGYDPVDSPICPTIVHSNLLIRIYIPNSLNQYTKHLNPTVIMYPVIPSLGITILSLFITILSLLYNLWLDQRTDRFISSWTSTPHTLSICAIHVLLSGISACRTNFPKYKHTSYSLYTMTIRRIPTNIVFSKQTIARYVWPCDQTTYTCHSHSKWAYGWRSLNLGVNMSCENKQT